MGEELEYIPLEILKMEKKNKQSKVCLQKMEDKIRIKFEYTDENGDNYMSESTLDVLYDMGDKPIDVIGRQLNAFLRQCGYTRRNNLIFMEDILEEEYDALADYLSELRENGDSSDKT